MNQWNILGILFIVVGVSTLAINVGFDVFMGDTILSTIFALMSLMMIIAGTIMGMIRSQNPKQEPLQLSAVGVFFRLDQVHFFSWVLGLDRPGFFSYYYHRQQIADGGQMAKTLGKKKREHLLSLSIGSQPYCLIYLNFSKSNL